MININIPEKFNAATYLLDRHLEQGKSDKLAVICHDRELTYKEIYEEVNRLGNAFLKLGVEMENRVFLLMPDMPELICAILASMKIGAVPLVANTLLPVADITYILNDSRAKTAVVHQSLLASLDLNAIEHLQHIVVVGQAGPDQLSYQQLVQEAATDLKPANTSRYDDAVWQYSSGTTGAPKGIIHMHQSILYHYHSYAEGILQMTDQDRIFSVAKLFFGYGQSNGLYWPFCAGATSILLPERPEPDAIAQMITEHKPTIFCGVPTAFNAILQLPGLKEKFDFSSVRICTSAGEALPPTIYQQWLDTFQTEIIDGIGSTECFHIFISNRPGKVLPGSTGQPIPGFAAKVVDEEGNQLPTKEIGNLMIKGGSSSSGYWNKHDLTQHVFLGEWVKTGDKFYVDENGFYWFVGRGDDMIKSGGIWVSPIEVESTIISHPAVLECGVIGSAGEDGLIKPKAFVVLKDGYVASAEFTKELQEFVKSKIAPYKYPRKIVYVQELPKTPTGKLQRFKLREIDVCSR